MSSEVKSRRRGRGAEEILFWALIILVVFVACFPALWLLITSFKSPAELSRIPITYLPEKWTIVNYIDLFTVNPFSRFMLNSIVVTVLSTVVNVLVSLMASYALARLDLPGKRLILGFILVFAMLPAMAFIVPIYDVIRKLGWLNTYQGLMGPYVTFQLPLSIMILTSFFEQVPKDLEEAAMIDGASPFQSMFKVIVPLAAPGLVSAGILVAIMIWNDFLIAMTLTTKVSMRTLPVGIVLYPGEFAFPWGTIAAASTLAVFPITIFILFAQRWIVRGLTAGALKG